ncbi:hypothetical protein [Nocardioides alcanivorans]|uniref:hypothetical protein n=1 Tax=Nocardioides alcanivorans TaxID=2897352 RepID=UPI001F172BD0|nr:hypothetical protein [Nocardioides alcanivorans]
MSFSRARKAVATAFVSSALVLGVTTVVQAAPANTAGAEQTVQAVARKAPAKKKLNNAKKKTTKLAVKKQKAYRKVKSYLDKNSAKIPAQVRTTATKQVNAGSKRIDKLTVKVSKAKKVKKVKKLRAKIKAQRPNDIKQLVVIAQRAVAAAEAGDAGLLEELLKDLAGLNIDSSILGPVISLVDDLLDAVLNLGGGNGNPVGGLLDGLLDLIDNLLGGLLGGLFGGR